MAGVSGIRYAQVVMALCFGMELRPMRVSLGEAKIARVSAWSRVPSHDNGRSDGRIPSDQIGSSKQGGV